MGLRIGMRVAPGVYVSKGLGQRKKVKRRYPGAFEAWVMKPAKKKDKEEPK
jgi:hypothetical protein